MAKSLEIQLSSSVLTWARTTIGYTIDDVAKKLGIQPERLKLWEEGNEKPTYLQLEKLAYNIYKRPIAVFFRKEPPIEKPIEQDFRNLTSKEIELMSPELRLIIRKAKRLQNLVKDLNADIKTVPVYKQFKVSIKDNPVSAANRFREFINLPIDEQKKWQSEKSFDNFKEYVEKIGIFVFQFHMPFEEARAFSLTDENPIIVLNAEDAKNGRIFSLFHEVCHILFNIGDIFRDKETKALKSEYKAIEDFCNSFASAFLVPEDLLKKDIQFQKPQIQEWSDKDLDTLAKLYKVSREVILRKLVELHCASASFYFSRKKNWDSVLLVKKESQKLKQKEEGRSSALPQDIKTVSEKGKLYITKVLDGFDKGKLTYSEISEFLEVKLDYLPKIIERINK